MSYIGKVVERKFYKFGESQVIHQTKITQNFPPQICRVTRSPIVHLKYRMGANFRGVLIFVDFVGSLHPLKTVAWVPCTHSCKSYMPRKYKPSKSSYLFKPRKFKPSNLSTRTVLLYIIFKNSSRCHLVHHSHQY